MNNDRWDDNDDFSNEKKISCKKNKPTIELSPDLINELNVFADKAKNFIETEDIHNPEYKAKLDEIREYIWENFHKEKTTDNIIQKYIKDGDNYIEECLDENGIYNLIKKDKDFKVRKLI